MRATISSISLGKKPESNSPEFHENRNRLIESDPKSIEIQDFADEVGNKGHSFLLCNHSPLYMNGKPTIKSDTAVDFQFIALDFDGKSSISPRQVIDRLKQEQLDATFVYRTFSDPYLGSDYMDNCTKFRVIITIEQLVVLEAIGGKEGYSNIYTEYLHKVFPEADHAIKDPARMLYGGKGLIYSNYDFKIDINYLFNLSDNYACKNTKGKRKKNQVFQKRISQRSTSENLSTNNQSTVTKKRRLQWSEERWIYARREWPFLDDFLSAKSKIEHRELFKLYIAMDEIEKGDKLWVDAIKANPEIDDMKIHNIADWVKKSKKAGVIYYEPTITSIDPGYRKGFKKLTGITKANHVAKSKPFKDPSFKLKESSWEEINKEIQAEIRKFFNCVGKNTLLKAPTGSGKTTAVINQFKNSPDHCLGTIWAFPRHDLKIEVSKKLKADHVKHIVLPKEPELNGDLALRVKTLRDMGLIKDANSLLKKVAEGDTATLNEFSANISSSLISDLKQFFDDVSKAINSQHLVLATHNSLFGYPFPNHNRLIIDEDISMMRVGKNSVTDLKKLISDLPDSCSVRKFLADLVESLNNTSIILLNKLDLKTIGKGSKNIIISSGIKKIWELLEAQVFVAIRNKDTGLFESIGFGTKEVIKPRFKSVLIMSASPRILALERLFENLDIIDLGYAKNKGALIQYSQRSLTASCLNEHEVQETLKEIDKIIGNTPVISHKNSKIKEIFGQENNFHNNSGINSFEDSDLIIIGTEFAPEFVFIVEAILLGYAIVDTNAQWQQVSRNGWVFPFRTFYDKNLRELHLSYVEGLVIQAAGRPRINRWNRKVFLMLKYLHPQASLADIRFDQVTDYLHHELHMTGSLDFGNNIQFEKFGTTR